MSTTRRQVLKYGLAGGAGMAGYALLGDGWTAQAATTTATLASFTQPLQVPPVLDMTGGGSYTLTAKHLTRQLHPKLPKPTNVWSYVSQDAVDVNATPYKGFLGPTVVVQKGTGVTATYVNDVEANYGQASWLPCDRNFTMNNDDQVRLLTHLHGGFVHGQMDGNPAVDMGYTKVDNTQTVWYGNEQRGGLIWYHDHGMGNTRLNVWAGLAGGYVIRDAFDTGLADNPNGLPDGYGSGPGQYEVPLVFQDRLFLNTATSGDMLYPTFPQNGVQGSWGLAGGGLSGNDPGMGNQYGNVNGPWSGEAFGDQGLVNGLVTPFLNTEPRLYRFRCLNGCNARILDLQLTGGLVNGTKSAPPPPMWIIGNDGGLLPAPVKVKTLTMMPGERYDVLVDFTGYSGKVQWKNTNLNGAYTSPAPRLVDFLQFNLGTTVTSTRNNSVPTTLQGGQHANPGAATVSARTINMFEMNANAMHWWMGLLGTGGGPSDVDVPVGGFADLITPAWNANTFHQEIGEKPPENSIQEWDFVNNTADSHPMHIHLVQFQVVHRRKNGVAAAGVADGTLVNAWEKGWKDTVAVHPGQTTRLRIKFELPPASPVAPPAGFTPAGVSAHYNLTSGQAERCFVYHCHILEHEENDMMRPFLVT